MLITLLGIHVAIGLVLMIVGSRTLYGSDGIIRYHELATTPGLPYRDFPVEFAPLDTLFISLVGQLPLRATYVLIVFANLLADLLCSLVLARRWGDPVCVAYLALFIPVLTFAFQGTEMIWLLVTVVGAALISSGDRWQRRGGALLGLAVLARIWPITLTPSLATYGRRGAATFFATVLAGLLLWFAITPSGPGQVASFRNAQGWEVESTVGAVTWILGDAAPSLDQGAPRLGRVLGWERLVLAGLLAVGLAGVAWRMRIWDGDAFGTPALASVAIVLFLAPVFSIEYIVWIIPWTAICAGEKASRVYAGLGAIAIVLTGALAIAYLTLSSDGFAQSLLVSRNLVVMAIPIVWLMLDRRGRAPIGSDTNEPLATTS